MMIIIQWVLCRCQILCQEFSIDYFIQSSTIPYVGTIVISVSLSFFLRRKVIYKSQVTYLPWGIYNVQMNQETALVILILEMTVLTPDIPCFRQIQAKCHPFVRSMWIRSVQSLFSDAEEGIVEGPGKVQSPTVRSLTFNLAQSLFMAQWMYHLCLVSASLRKLCPSVLAWKNGHKPTQQNASRRKISITICFHVV